MLSLVLGLEDSFVKSFFYVLFLASIITICGSALYFVMAGLPMLLARTAVQSSSQE